MNYSDLDIPSDRKFGGGVSAIFFVIAIYSFNVGSVFIFFLFMAVSFSIAAIALIKSEWLRPINKAWMRLGYLMGSIVSPVVLSIIYFLVFVPIAISMRIFGRDELRLKYRKKDTFWVRRDSSIQSESFKNQF